VLNCCCLRQCSREPSQISSASMFFVRTFSPSVSRSPRNVYRRHRSNVDPHFTVRARSPSIAVSACSIRGADTDPGLDSDTGVDENQSQTQNDDIIDDERQFPSNENGNIETPEH
jgi:hypothetical protein